MARNLNRITVNGETTLPVRAWRDDAKFLRHLAIDQERPIAFVLHEMIEVYRQHVAKR